MSKVILTGAFGYVGSVVQEYLLSEDVFTSNVDLNWFKVSSDYSESNLAPRDFSALSDEELAECDTVIHLAAVSNDPMGDGFNSLTEKTNIRKTEELLRRCSKLNVRKVIFASSCSVYGTQGKEPKTELSLPNPLTAYAKSKVEIERLMLDLSKSTSNGTQFVALRFATAAGPSGNLRVDLVLNDFVWSALEERVIRINSDGSPLRPIVDVRDMSRAIVWAMKENFKHAFTILNVGKNEHNFSVLELANQVRHQLPGVQIQVLGGRSSDLRSYEVDFKNFQERIDFHFYPIEQTISDLVSQIEALLAEGKIKNDFVRLDVLSKLLGSQQ